MKPSISTVLALIFLILSHVASILSHGMGHGEPCHPGDTEHFCDPLEYLVCDETSHKCACLPGLLVNKKGVCEAGYETVCSESASPNSTDYCSRDRYLLCTSAKCECQNKDTQIFDRIQQKCALKLGQEDCTMNPDDWSLNCVSDAFCEMLSSEGSMVHKCVECQNFDTDGFVCLDEGNMEHGMSMWFHVGKDEVILFKFWKTSKTEWFILSLVIIFFMAFAYEGLKHWRDQLLKNRPNNKTGSKILNPFHCIQTLLHMVQFVTSYFLMLIFMTYNVWLAMAVTLGAGAGYFCFGWSRMSSIDSSDHCA